MQTMPIGSIIGAVAGLTFVLVNASAVPGTLVWSIAAVAGFVAIGWYVVVRGSEVTQAPPSRSAMRTYTISVTAMVVAIPVGAAIISNVFSKPDAVLAWVVFVVGAHFVPFASAFALPIFKWLSATLLIVAILGAAAILASDSATAAGWTGVTAGFVLLAFSGFGPRLSASPARA